MQDIVLISIPESTIRNIVEQAVRKVIAENSTLPTATTEDKLLSRKEAADLVGVCLATLDNKVKGNVLRKYRTGGVVRFKRLEVLDAFSQSLFENGKRATNAQSKKR